MINVTQKKEHYAIGINHYLTRCLLIIELINNDMMWWYFPFFFRFSPNGIRNPFFILEFGYILPIKKGCFEKAIVVLPMGQNTWYNPW
jgi:hypothetical protein